jgi:hypothetical protein
MKKDLKCKKHKYIGKRIEIMPSHTGLPLECKICGKMYFPENPLIFKTASLQKVNICAACREKLQCSACKQKFILKKFFVAECTQCGKLEFYCKKCSKKLPTLPLGCEPHEQILRKMQKILKEYMPDIGDNLPKDLKDLKKFKGFGDIPSYLFLHFNIILPPDFGRFEEEDDDADWWKKK